jgi:hypothetical protein
MLQMLYDNNGQALDSTTLRTYRFQENIFVYTPLVLFCFRCLLECMMYGPQLCPSCRSWFLMTTIDFFELMSQS